jgi:hypothetical protein
MEFFFTKERESVRINFIHLCHGEIHPLAPSGMRHLPRMQVPGNATQPPPFLPLRARRHPGCTRRGERRRTKNGGGVRPIERNSRGSWSRGCDDLLVGSAPIPARTRKYFMIRCTHPTILRYTIYTRTTRGIFQLEQKGPVLRNRMRGKLSQTKFKREKMR